MYLKSLVIKGFKSFADKVVLNLEPGIMAVVGPNGSGKSNISDAVLWVLGERSARNLRGQAMEDIIFAGSAARKAVSLAEVELVLDNSDQTLPVDYEEVVITRRMYRTGESEYLLNGVTARRLDVLDILHDTGLGTGTHSIISQGSLDSILQSKPEDRRALIEEAAGVLKHKQRKEKSARKLTAMDNHLARVRDVAGEVKRQLGPLERKAKRAEAYKDISGQLEALKLELALDELRQLQQEWENVCNCEKTLKEEVENQKLLVAQAEQKVSDFQELIQRESQDANELSKRQRRASSLAEKLDANDMLLRERRRSAIAYEADLQANLQSADIALKQAQNELVHAQDQYNQATEDAVSASAKAEELSIQKRSLDEQVRSIQSYINELNTNLQEIENETNLKRKKRETLQESLANGLAHVKLVEARKLELATDLEHAQEEERNALEHLKAQKAQLEELQDLATAAEAELSHCFNEKELAQSACDEAHKKLKSIESEISALQQAIRTKAEEDPALLWLFDNADVIQGGISSLASALRVDSSLEKLVEALLEDDLSALAACDARAAQEISQLLSEGSLAGDVSVVIKEHVSLNAAIFKDAHEAKAGKALVDLLRYPQDMEAAVRALLGDVVLFESRDEAFNFWLDPQFPYRIATSDGCVLYPSGKMHLYDLSHAGASEEGVLARERRLDDAKERKNEQDGLYASALASLALADENYRAAQSASLKLSQDLATHKGVCASAEAEHERTSKRLSSMCREADDIEQQVLSAQKTVDELRPELEQLEESLRTLTQKQEECLELRTVKINEISPLRKNSGTLQDALNEVKLALAKFEERKTYAFRILDTRKQNINSIQEQTKDATNQLLVKRVVAKRGVLLLEIYARLAQSLLGRTRLLDAAFDAAQSASDSVHSEASLARNAARKAHDDYDEANTRMSSILVEKSRLEVQVEAAVHVVVHDCETPLEIAQQLPELENKQEAIDEKFKLERRIKAMGVINPEAAREYAVLKERFDFLQAQLDDMEAARRSLNRIVRVIDNRMKDDFVQTFNQVNTSFNQIFSILFPGGSAFLSLVDPDDIENSGIEVTAQPRGKRITKMMLMSGGEKSLTALALLFAVYKTRSTPFYILDEVEAALDDTNLRRLIAYIENLRSETQLIMITHQRRTMEMADTLYGVSMQADGVTRVISQKLERALEQAQKE